jgi:dGTPase
MAENMGLVKLGGANDAAWCRHPLAFLVEAADDICYNIIDLEDGTNLGLVSLDETKLLLAEIIGDRFDEEKYRRISSVKEKVSSLRALAITELIHQCVSTFMEKEAELLAGTFDKALTDHIPASPVLQKIQKISLLKIYKSRPVIEREIAGFEVLNGLLDAFVPAVLRLRSEGKGNWHDRSLVKLLPLEIQEELESKGDVYELLLVLLDFVSGITDSYALSLFRNIKGISLPSD